VPSCQAIKIYQKTSVCQLYIFFWTINFIYFFYINFKCFQQLPLRVQILYGPCPSLSLWHLQLGLPHFLNTFTTLPVQIKPNLSIFLISEKYFLSNSSFLAKSPDLLTEVRYTSINIMSSFLKRKLLSILFSFFFAVPFLSCSLKTAPIYPEQKCNLSFQIPGVIPGLFF